jgi:hypothetical protein
LYGQKIGIGKAELLILTIGTLSLIGLGIFGAWRKITSSNISKVSPAKAL